MFERVAVVTGASAGIGLAAARGFLERGWRVIATGRNPQRCAAAAAELSASATPGQLTFLRADLSILAEARALAAGIAELTPVVHALANNAGGLTDCLRMTSEGLEENFAGNHVGPVVLTDALMPLLRAAAAQTPPGTVRIVNTSSEGSERVPTLDLDDIQNLSNWSFNTAYCVAKLANLLHVRALAPRVAADGLVAHAFHPGTVDTNFANHANEATRKAILEMPMITADEGADTLLWRATAEEPARSTGGYWDRRAPRAANPLADDPAVVERFHAETEKLIAAAG